MAAAEDQVLIIGAGLSGLALANVLKNKGIPYKIFERETSPQDRTQGWSLSLHFCLSKLFALVDPAKVQTFSQSTAVDPSRPHDAGFAMIDGPTGDAFLSFDMPSAPGTPAGDGNPRSPPLIYRVNRKRLRDWLMQGIDVQWNKAIDHYALTKDGNNIKVTFKDGTIEHGRVLVGADGVNSVVCRQWIGDEQFRKATSLNPVKVIGGTRKYDSAQGKPFPTTSMLCLGKSEKNNITLFASVSDTLMRSANFDPKLGDLVLGAPEGSKVIGLRIRERSPAMVFGAPNKTAGPVTVIGDAAHSMTMFRGEGGNHAILDACILGEYLVDAYNAKITINEALQKYQNDILPRTIKAVEDSHQASYIMHGPREPIIQMVSLLKQRK
ncbi:hypothetical protein BX666DRAFT_1858414 [Dichotomocladium elegans]|nr:hypothetical protein BX666DRAFT_1858414 [Dichotomocladium elegans]